MRFLCLHGMGENGRVSLQISAPCCLGGSGLGVLSQRDSANPLLMRNQCLFADYQEIFEYQTAAIRQLLGPQHTYHWIDGSIATQMAPGLEGLVSLHDEFFTYADHTEESGAKTLRDLERLVEEDGPFDGIMGFSLGARCAATLLIHQIRCSQALKASQPVFRCAVFFCGGAPEDPTALLSSGDRRVMCFETDGEVIDIPTAHIWGRNDHRYHYGPQLSKLCNISNREVYVHDGGHEIPGSRDPVATAKAARSIKRTIARASMTRF